MTNKTQIEFVKSILFKDEEVSRNFCLRHFISRLGAIIYKLKKEGYQFETERRRGDFIYKIIK